MADSEVVTELTIDASGTEEGGNQFLATMQEIEVVLQSLLNIMAGVQTQWKSMGDQMALVDVGGNGLKSQIYGVTDAVGGMGSSAGAAASGTGVLGDAFSALGSAASAVTSSLGGVGVVIGLLATGGAIAAGVAGFKAMSDAADSAGESANELVTAASNLGLTTAQLQALRQAGADVNVTTTATDSAVQHFAQQLDSLRQGTGALYTELMRVNPALAQQMQTTKSLPVEFQLLGQAYSAAGTEADKLAKTALGTNSASALGRGLLGPLATTGMAAMTVKDQAGLGPTSDQKEQWSELVDQIKTAKTEASEIFSSMFTTQFLQGELATAQFMDDFVKAAKEFSLSGDLSKFINFFSKEMPALPAMPSLPTRTPDAFGISGQPIYYAPAGNDVFGAPPASAVTTPEEPATQGGINLTGGIQSVLDRMSSNAFAGYGNPLDNLQAAGTDALGQLVDKIQNFSVSADLKSLLATLGLTSWPLLDKLATIIGAGASMFGHTVSRTAGPGRVGGLGGVAFGASEAILQEGFSAVVAAIETLWSKGAVPAEVAPAGQSPTFAQRFGFGGGATEMSAVLPLQTAAIPQTVIPAPAATVEPVSYLSSVPAPLAPSPAAPSASSAVSPNPLASSDTDQYLKEQTADAKVLGAAIDALNASESKIPQTAAAAYVSYQHWESALGGAATAAEQMELESRKLAAANPPLSSDVITRAQTYKDLQIQIASTQQMVTAGVGDYNTVLQEQVQKVAELLATHPDMTYQQMAQAAQVAALNVQKLNEQLAIKQSAFPGITQALFNAQNLNTTLDTLGTTSLTALESGASNFANAIAKGDDAGKALLTTFQSLASAVSDALMKAAATTLVGQVTTALGAGNPNGMTTLDTQAATAATILVQAGNAAGAAIAAGAATAATTLSAGASAGATGSTVATAGAAAVAADSNGLKDAASSGGAAAAAPGGLLGGLASSGLMAPAMAGAGMALSLVQGLISTYTQAEAQWQQAQTAWAGMQTQVTEFVAPIAGESGSLSAALARPLEKKSKRTGRQIHKICEFARVTAKDTSATVADLPTRTELIDDRDQHRPAA